MPVSRSAGEGVLGGVGERYMSGVLQKGTGTTQQVSIKNAGDKQAKEAWLSVFFSQLNWVQT